VTLLQRVARALQREGIPHALIGAGALAVHGVSRSTLDHDFLTTDTRALDAALWREMPNIDVDIRRGDADDPLAGAIRFRAAGERDVDLVIGRGTWQRDVITRAEPVRIGGIDVPVVTAADLVLLKLYAGGTQDKWDIEQLLAVASQGQLRTQVENHLPALPSTARELWDRQFR
jgi:predicted nucleotidyltransferase